MRDAVSGAGIDAPATKIFSIIHRVLTNKKKERKGKGKEKQAPLFPACLRSSGARCEDQFAASAVSSPRTRDRLADSVNLSPSECLWSRLESRLELLQQLIMRTNSKCLEVETPFSFSTTWTRIFRNLDLARPIVVFRFVSSIERQNRDKGSKMRL